jgi:8-oxo-dGTP diphosphatase
VDGWVECFAARTLEEKMLVQVREKDMPHLRLQHFLSRVLTHAVPLGSRVVVNSDCGRFPQCDGLHLTSRALMSAAARPDGSLAGASCHDERELAQAEALGLDYAVLGPVKETASHPQATPLGWDKFAALARDRAIPVYAIGGLSRGDLEEARRNGAHGVALLSAAFS